MKEYQVKRREIKKDHAKSVSHIVREKNQNERVKNNGEREISVCVCV